MRTGVNEFPRGAGITFRRDNDTDRLRIDTEDSGVPVQIHHVGGGNAIFPQVAQDRIVSRKMRGRPGGGETAAEESEGNR